MAAARGERNAKSASIRSRGGVSTRTSTRTRLSSGVVMLAAVGLALSGCATAPQGPETPEGESAWQAEAFPAVYAQDVEWGACDAEFGLRDDIELYAAEKGGNAEGSRCAMIEAPLDWNDPASSSTIELAVIHLPATGADPIGTLFSNPGGPGGSGVDYALGLTTLRSFDAVHEQYDLLGFDPRGIGRSTPVECDTEVDTDIFELLIALCADNDPLAGSMGTEQVARDMDLLRHLMGDEQTFYAGFSYGTVIGATYATLFPERLGRMLLDSAWPSDWSSPLGSYQQNEAFAYSVNHLLSQCASDFELTLCPLSGETALIDTMRQLDNEPLVATDGTAVTGRVLYGYLSSGLYQPPSGRQSVLDVTGRALSGEQAAIDQLTDEMSGGGAQVSLAGMIVRCLSTPRDANLGGVYEYITEHGLPPVLGGPEISDGTLRQFLDLSCEALPESGSEYMMFENASDVPILVMGITGDHATPYAGAVQLVEELGNARLLTLDGSGHIASFSDHSTCADEAAVAYLLRGELPPEGTVCTEG